MTLTERETATILHALRSVQTNLRLDIPDGCGADGECECFNDVTQCLNSDEIDVLCASIITGIPARPSVLITVNGGNAEVGEAHGAVDVDILDYDNLKEALMLCEEGQPDCAALILSDAELSFLQRNDEDLWKRAQPFVNIQPTGSVQ